MGHEAGFASFSLAQIQRPTNLNPRKFIPHLRRTVVASNAKAIYYCLSKCAYVCEEMAMILPDWVKLLAAFLTGPSLWIITTLYNRKQNSLQEITLDRRVTKTDLVPKNVPKGARLKVSIQHGGAEVPVDRLYVVEITLRNETKSKDFDTFDFKITFPGGVTAIDTDITTPDASHTALETNAPDDPEDYLERSRANPYSMEYQLKPFSRRNTYTFQFTLAPFQSSMAFEGSHYLARLAHMTTVVSYNTIQVSTPEAGVTFRDSWEEAKNPSVFLLLAVIFSLILLVVFLPALLSPQIFPSENVRQAIAIGGIFLTLAVSLFTVYYVIHDRRRLNRHIY